MLFGRYVAEHGATVPAYHCSPYPRCDVIIARCNVSDKRPKCVERCLVAHFELFIYVLLNHVHGDVSRSLDYGLHIVLPGQLGKFTKGLQLTELGCIISIGD